VGVAKISRRLQLALLVDIDDHQALIPGQLQALRGIFHFVLSVCLVEEVKGNVAEKSLINN